MSQRVLDRRRINVAFQTSALKVISEFGSSAKTSVFYHIGKMLGTSTVEDALCDPIQFSAALESIFSQGALVIEEKIIEGMCLSLGINYERTKGTFDEKLASIYELEQNKKDARFMVKIGALEQTMQRVA